MLVLHQDEVALPGQFRLDVLVELVTIHLVYDVRAVGIVIMVVNQTGNDEQDEGTGHNARDQEGAVVVDDHGHVGGDDEQPQLVLDVVDEIERAGLEAGEDDEEDEGEADLDEGEGEGLVLGGHLGDEDGDADHHELGLDVHDLVLTLVFDLEVAVGEGGVGEGDEGERVVTENGGESDDHVGEVEAGVALLEGGSCTWFRVPRCRCKDSAIC